MTRKVSEEPPVEIEENYLESHEHEEAQRRAAPRVEIVYEAVRSEGEHELSRPVVALAWSGLAAGLSMGFSFLARSLLASYLPDTHWASIVSDLGYSVGFLIVILGRQQLFTENTLTPILVLLQRRDLDCLWRVLRLWLIVLLANTVGAFIFALLIAKTSLLSPDMHNALLATSRSAFSADFFTMLLRGVFAGWLIATLIWLLPFAETARVAVIVIITYVIALGQFAHIIAGAVEAFYVVVIGNASWGMFFGRFYAPVLIGNIIGGVALVAALNYGQITAMEIKKAPSSKAQAKLTAPRNCTKNIERYETLLIRFGGDLDATAVDAHGIGGHVLVGGRRKHGAVAQVKACAVARTFDFVALDHAAGEFAAVVSAHILNGVELTVHVDDRDLDILRPHGLEFAGLQFVNRANVYPLTHRSSFGIGILTGKKRGKSSEERELETCRRRLIGGRGSCPILPSFLASRAAG